MMAKADADDEFSNKLVDNEKFQFRRHGAPLTFLLL
jgi:hypothetical protein